MTDVLIMLAVFGGSFGVGYLLISRVPPLLHTPLMSMTNAISAVTILGGVVLFTYHTTPTKTLLASIAVVMAVFNLVGGFAITHRMLRLFKKKQES